MKPKITVRKVDHVAVIDLKGPLAIGESEDLFRERVAKLLEEKSASILVNFENVDFIDSSGVGALIKCLTSVTKAGGTMKGLRPGPAVQRILKITGVYNLFEFFDDEKRAIASF
jgi:anti-sigma B factor antagonist